MSALEGRPDMIRTSANVPRHAMTVFLFDLNQIQNPRL
jgi:hypothetical protein